MGTLKFKSKEFKTALKQVKEVFDAHSLGVILLDALERRAAEQIYTKTARQSRGTRISNKKKSELVGHLTAAFFAVDDVAFQIVKELDRACGKERHIVASIPEAQAPDRIGSYRAISLKRERAKLVWALARDERASVRELANRIISQFFAEAADVETTRAVLEGSEDESALNNLELAKRLQEQAERLAEASEKVTDLESKVSGFNEERAKLMAQIGSKERTLRQESEARGELESQLDGLRKALAQVESEQGELEAAKASEGRARAEAEELQQRVRRLSKLAGASKTLAQTQEELEQANRSLEERERESKRERESFEREREGFEREQSKLRAELESTRDELKRARKQVADLDAELERIAPDVPQDNQLDESSVAILLDQANLAATASMSFRRKVNFAGLYDVLRAGRKVVRAVAFVVDNGGSSFEAFCDTLRRSGWDLRVKRPKVFQDGQTKADWDMGIAMESIALKGQVKTIVLASGDGDFAPLVKQLKRWGHRVEVAAYPDGLAKELASAADHTIRLTTNTLES